MKEMELEELKQELRQEYWFMGLLGKSPPCRSCSSRSGTRRPVKRRS